MSVASSKTGAPNSQPGAPPRAAPHGRLHRWLPITAWAGGYHRRWLRADTIAALTVIGLLVHILLAK